MKHSDVTHSPLPFELEARRPVASSTGIRAPARCGRRRCVNEKRVVLASWASDPCAVETAPVLRHAPGAAGAVSVDEILETLRSLDKEANDAAGRTVRGRREARRRAFEAFRLRRGPGWGLSR